MHQKQIKVLESNEIKLQLKQKPLQTLLQPKESNRYSKELVAAIVYLLIAVHG
jgi:hypothetical protein